MVLVRLLHRLIRRAKWYLVRASRGLFKSTFILLDLLVPKLNSLVILASNGGKAICGNSKALYEYMLNVPCGLVPYYYLRKPGEHKNDPGCLSGKSWRTIINFLRARTVISTHGTGDFSPYRFSRRKLFVQTWHGVGPKADGLNELSNPNPRMVECNIRAHKRWDVFIAPSKIAAYNMCACIMMDPRKIFLCGQPRNDILLKRRQATVPLQTLLPCSFKKVILYCPTYRRFANIQFFPFEDFDKGIMDSFLEEHDAVLLLRAHINEQNCYKSVCSERIIEFGSSVCGDVNDILSDVDVLITDYSSIYVDFLLLDRPIIFLPYDWEEYSKRRGILFDDYDFWTPGPKVSKFQELLIAVEDALTYPDKFSQHRRTINSLLNYHQDGDSCGKIVQMIKEKVGIKH